MDLTSYVTDLRSIWPEIVLSVTALLALVSDLLLKGRDVRVTGWVTVLGVLFTIGLLCGDFAHAHGEAAFGMMVHDRFALFFKLLIASGLLVVTLLSMFFRGFQKDGVGEYYSLLVTAAVGSFFLVSTNHLLLLFLGLETLSIASYALAGFLKKDVRSSEAAIKYLVFGVLSTGAMVYGFSLLYGFAGSLELPKIAATIRSLLDAKGEGGHGLTPAGVGVAIAVVLSIAGFAYKVAAFPFHFWSPDVYEGAPTPVTTFLSVVSKAASFGMILRFFAGVAHDGGSATIASVVALLAACSMTLGNLAAMLQDNSKRLLAYSSIAHSGYMLAGVAALLAPATTMAPAETGASGGAGSIAFAYGLSGGQAVAFYVAAYAIMNLGAFASVVCLSNRFGTESIHGWTGLGWKAPVASGAFVMFLLSLTGLPPTVGFVGKWALLQPIWAKGLHWLAVVLVLNSIVSLFYYFRIAKSLLLKDESLAMASPRKGAFQLELSTVLVALAASTVWFGVAGGFQWLSELVLSIRV